jgi:prevent-host-death family protein
MRRPEAEAAVALGIGVEDRLEFQPIFHSYGYGLLFAHRSIPWSPHHEGKRRGKKRPCGEALSEISPLLFSLDSLSACSHTGCMRKEIVARKTVGSRELKTRLGTYLHQVRRGTTIVVTDRGQPVAELRPLDREAKEEKARLAELTTLGVVSHEEQAPLAPFRPIRSMGASLSSAVTEDREDRF